MEAALGIGIVTGTVEGKGEVQAGGGVARRARGSRGTMAAVRGPQARAGASAFRRPGSKWQAGPVSSLDPLADRLIPACGRIVCLGENTNAQI